MTAPHLPDDIARCTGVGDDEEGWREGCEDCLRRLAPSHDPRRVVNMQPPPIIVFWCEYHIPGVLPTIPGLGVD